MVSRHQLSKVCITGGAGYIGSHIALLLQSQGYQVIVLDNLSTGNHWSVPQSCLIRGDISDQHFVLNILRLHQVDIVIHLAAKSSVPDSFLHPEAYIQTNVEGTYHVLNACIQAKVKHMIFASTAAVYGNATHGFVDETSPTSPISPYGKSKLEAEGVIQDICSKHGMNYLIFRFFNVIGAHPSGVIGQYNPSSSHLLHMCLQCIRQTRTLDIYGHDYPTADGTAERDYIHVQDLADLHLQGLKHLMNGGSSAVLNAGYGHTHSTLQFVQTFEQACQHSLNYRYTDRRAGDPASLIANVSKLKSMIVWKPQYDSLWHMISSAWQWENSPMRQSLP